MKIQGKWLKLFNKMLYLFRSIQWFCSPAITLGIAPVARRLHIPYNVLHPTGAIMPLVYINATKT